MLRNEVSSSKVESELDREGNIIRKKMAPYSAGKISLMIDILQYYHEY